MILVGGILLVVLGLVPEPWRVPFLVAAAVVEVAETSFWLWLTHRSPPVLGAQSLVGKQAVVVTPCRPVGQVRIEGETWRARCEAGADSGESVRVQSVRGLSLVVERSG